MISTLVDGELTPVPITEFLDILEIYKNSVHSSVYKKYWCGDKLLDIEVLLKCLKFN